MCQVLLTLKQVSWCYSMIKLAKMPQNMKSSDRFRTIFNSAVVCQLFQAPYRRNDNEANQTMSLLQHSSRPGYISTLKL